MPHISIKAERIFSIFGFHVTNSLMASFIVTFLFFILALYYHKQIRLTYKKRSALFYVVHYLNSSLYKFFSTITGEKIDVFFPLLITFFLYIIVQNWFGLIPGVGSILIAVEEHGKHLHIPLLRGNTADLNTTLALGIITVSATQYYGIKILGFKRYLKKFFDLSNPISLFTGVLEIFSEFSKVISFSFRLFGNIFAGEVLLVVIAFLIPVLASFPFLMLEIFVGFIQALVFATLTAVFISSATVEHHY